MAESHETAVVPRWNSGDRRRSAAKFIDCTGFRLNQPINQETRSTIFYHHRSVSSHLRKGTVLLSSPLHESSSAIVHPPNCVRDPEPKQRFPDRPNQVADLRLNLALMRSAASLSASDSYAMPQCNSSEASQQQMRPGCSSWRQKPSSTMISPSATSSAAAAPRDKSTWKLGVPSLWLLATLMLVLLLSPGVGAQALTNNVTSLEGTWSSGSGAVTTGLVGHKQTARQSMGISYANPFFTCRASSTRLPPSSRRPRQEGWLIASLAMAIGSSPSSHSTPAVSLSNGALRGSRKGPLLTLLYSCLASCSGDQSMCSSEHDLAAWRIHHQQ